MSSNVAPLMLKQNSMARRAQKIALEINRETERQAKSVLRDLLLTQDTNSSTENINQPTLNDTAIYNFTQVQDFKTFDKNYNSIRSSLDTQRLPHNQHYRKNNQTSQLSQNNANKQQMKILENNFHSQQNNTLNTDTINTQLNIAALVNENSKVIFSKHQPQLSDSSQPVTTQQNTAKNQSILHSPHKSQKSQRQSSFQTSKIQINHIQKDFSIENQPKTHRIVVTRTNRRFQKEKINQSIETQITDQKYLLNNSMNNINSSCQRDDAIKFLKKLKQKYSRLQQNSENSISQRPLTENRINQDQKFQLSSRQSRIYPKSKRILLSNINNNQQNYSALSNRLQLNESELNISNISRQFILASDNHVNLNSSLEYGSQEQIANRIYRKNQIQQNSNIMGNSHQKAIFDKLNYSNQNSNIKPREHFYVQYLEKKAQVFSDIKKHCVNPEFIYSQQAVYQNQK